MAQVGRGVFWKKTTTEECLRWDMMRIAKAMDLSVFGTGWSRWEQNGRVTDSIRFTVFGGSHIRPQYTITYHPNGTKEDVEYNILLDKTPCYFGRHRWWFRCPSCDRRCRIVYLPPGQKYFACRICHNLTYTSQQESRSGLIGALKFMQQLPKWQRKLRRARSQAKRDRLLTKIQRLELTASFQMAKDRKRWKW